MTRFDALRIRASIALDRRLTVLYAYIPYEETGMKHARLVVRLTGLGEAQAEGAVAVLALLVLVLGAALLAHWA
jgi:hypothetical protein